MKNIYAINAVSNKSSSGLHELERKIEPITAFDKPSKQSETDKLNKMISYILILRLILAIKMISAIFKMTTSKLVASPILHSNFHSLIFHLHNLFILPVLLDLMFKYCTVNQKSFLSLTVDFIAKFFRN